MIGKQLKELRKKSGKTQVEVAKETGLSRSGVLTMENEYNTPSFSAVEKYLTAIGYRVKFEKID